MENFRHLEVWQRSHRLAVAINRATRALPWYERLELASQMRRAATSVPFNIAEGCGRKVADRSNVEPLRYYSISSGSLHELDSQLEYARDVEYFSLATATPLLDEAGELRRMLGAFITRVRANDRHR